MKSLLPILRAIAHQINTNTDLERALGSCYGFDLTVRLGSGATLVSAGSYYYHIGLNSWDSLGTTTARR
jgi:catechol-2,3-dioxygenase